MSQRKKLEANSQGAEEALGQGNKGLQLALTTC